MNIATSTIPTSTNQHSLVSRHAETLKGLLRRARSLCTRKQESEKTRNLAKRVLSSSSSKAIENVCELVIDIAQRGSLEEAESIGQHLCAIARSEHAARHPDGAIVQLSRREAAIAEQMAQGERENAEKALDLDGDKPSLTNCLRFLAAQATYAKADRDLRAAVQREVASA